MYYINDKCRIKKQRLLFNLSYKVQIVPLVIYGLVCACGHTHTHTHTHARTHAHAYPHESDFRKPGTAGNLRTITRNGFGLDWTGII